VPSTLAAITLECTDPRELAVFYRRATGLELHPESDDRFAGLTREDGLFIGPGIVRHFTEYQAGGSS
jgi:glyoxalase superfamily protein